MGFIQDDRAPGLHVEVCRDRVELYTNYGQERVNIPDESLPGVIVSLVEADLRQTGKSTQEIVALLPELAGKFMERPEYLAGMATLVSGVEAETEIQRQLDLVRGMLPEGYAVVREKSGRIL